MIKEIAFRIKKLCTEYDSLCDIMAFDRALEVLQQRPVLLDKETTHKMILSQFNGPDTMFTLDLSRMNYPVVQEAEDFMIKWKLLMKELHAQYGPFRMIVD